MDFVAIDFETADNTRRNPCELGITVVRDGEIHDYSSYLIKPLCWPNFHPFAVKLHGITPEMVTNDRTFDQIWPEIRHYFELPIVAHSAGFDMSVLCQTLDAYGLEDGTVFPCLCTCDLARDVFPELPNHKIKTVCSHLGIELENHHGAGPDAKAAAEIVIRICEHLGIVSWNDLLTFIKDSTMSPPMKRQPVERRRNYAFKTEESDERIVYTGNKPDPNSQFFGKLIAMSGFSDERELNFAEIIEQIGGTYKKGSVTKKTDFLLVSNQYWDMESPTTKMKKAIEYTERGLPVTMISEFDFLKTVPHAIFER